MQRHLPHHDAGCSTISVVPIHCGYRRLHTCCIPALSWETHRPSHTPIKPPTTKLDNATAYVIGIGQLTVSSSFTANTPYNSPIASPVSNSAVYVGNYGGSFSFRIQTATRSDFAISLTLPMMWRTRRFTAGAVLVTYRSRMAKSASQRPLISTTYIHSTSALMKPGISRRTVFLAFDAGGAYWFR